MYIVHPVSLDIGGDQQCNVLVLFRKKKLSSAIFAMVDDFKKIGWNEPTITG